MWSSPSNPASKGRKIGVPTWSLHKALTFGILTITLGASVRNVFADRGNC